MIILESLDDNMLYKDLIINRKSVRTFDNLKEIEDDKIQLILAEIKKINNPFNNDFKIELFNAKDFNLDTNVSTGEKYFITSKIKTTKNHELAIGYMLEKLTIFLESININSVYMASTFDRNKFEKLINLKDGEVMPLIMPIGYKANMLNKKDRAIRRVLHSDTRLDIKDFSYDKDLNPFKPINYLSDILDTIKWSPSATNRQPIKLVINDDIIDFYIDHYKPYSNGITDIQKVDLGIMLMNLEFALKDIHKSLEYMNLSKKDISENIRYEISVKIK